MHHETCAPGCVHHCAHGWQVTPGEDVRADKVTGRTVRLVPLPRLCDGLQKFVMNSAEYIAAP